MALFILEDGTLINTGNVTIAQPDKRLDGKIHGVIFRFTNDRKHTVSLGEEAAHDLLNRYVEHCDQ